MGPLPRLDLARLVTAAAGAAWQPSAGSSLELVAPTPPVWVRADGELVGRVVRELVSNAGDAVARGGRVRVVVEQVVLSAPTPLTHPHHNPTWVVPPGRYARVSVSDDGPGVAPEMWPRLFEPFASTKPGPALGLGLATVLGIAKAVGWWVDAESAPGCTVFSLLIPFAEAEPTAAT